ncbi:MAG: hypothetical protein JWL66_1605 [Sphingomonadales bacterium]|nr:hypothetical protein [Sphingomonadales bacterium]
MLDRARRIGDAAFGYARNGPMLDGLRNQPRFGALLRGRGFEKFLPSTKGRDMNKLVILATGTVILMLAGCGPQAQNQADVVNAAAPVDDPMALNDSERTAVDNAAGADNARAGNAGADNASNAGDRTIGERTNKDK